MKLCGTWCMIAIVFLVATLYLTFTADKTERKAEFYKTLSADNIKRYEGLIRERRDIYLKGYILGLLLSIIFLYYTQNYKLKSGIICIVGGITLLVNYLFYMLYPKSDYMILHLNNKTQREKWLAIYKHMQFKYHIGLVLGIIAAMIFAKSVC